MVIYMRNNKAIMRKIIKLTVRLMFTVIITCNTLSCFAINAADKRLFPISPALSVLSEKLTLVKSGLTGTEVEFDTDDFDRIVGVSVPSVTFISLPDRETGVLTIEGKAVECGITIARSKLSELTFTPSSDSVSESSFSIGIVGNQAYECKCSIYMLSGLNFSPSAELCDKSFTHVTTYSGIPYFGTVHAVDPDGDSMTYRITEYPSHGILVTDEIENGNYKYVPSGSFSGEDSFSYIAEDFYGNFTPEIEVNISILNSGSVLSFSDMQENEEHSCALNVVNNGIMNASSENGIYRFNPDDSVSRCEYLLMLYKAAGRNISVSEKSSFGDTDTLSDEEIQCIEDAYKNGFISGERTTTGLYIKPDEPVSRAEAAVLTAKIAGIEIPVSLANQTFTDESAIQADMIDSVRAVCSIGIFRSEAGVFSPDRPLTRAEAAQALDGVLRYMA